ncbi:MAG: hypothetical protein H7263_10700 [Candidatus Sericytochromatia bacterium]|nr:hypothetical protein [Candidatus Sericytochromatia bacterium]
MEVKLETKNIVLSETLGVVNFIVQLRNAIVNKDSNLEQAFVTFDKAYQNFLNGVLSDDNESSTQSSVKEPVKSNTRSLLQEKEAEKIRLREQERTRKQEEEILILQREKEEQQAKIANRSGDAKSRLASLRSKTLVHKEQVNTLVINSKENSSLVPGHLPKPQLNETFIQPTQQPHTVKQQTGGLNMTVSAYTPLSSFSEKEIPKNRKGEADVKAIAKNLTSTLDLLKKGNVKPVDFKSILLKKFLQAFDLVCHNRKLVLTIDSFEKIQPLYSFFFNVFLKNIKSEFILLIGSQSDMERELKEKYDTNIMYIYMQNFTYIEIEEYIKKNHVMSEPSIIESIHGLTNGLPSAMSLINGAFQNFKGDVFKIMKFLGSFNEEDEKTLRYINVVTLDNLPVHDKKMIILLAIIREPNFELIESIAGVFNAKNLLQNLSDKYSFIEEKGLTELLKKFTRTYAKHEMPNLYEEIHQLAYDFFSKKVDFEPDNKNYITNDLYYHFRVNEHSAYLNLLGVIANYLGTDVSFCEELIQSISLVGLSKEMKNLLSILKDSLPYVILKDHKKTLPLLEAISRIQKSGQLNNSNSMQLLDGF